MNADLVTPVVNINGTDRKVLIAYHQDIARALKMAEISIANRMPHGRDFQTCDDPAAELTKAQGAFNDRRQLLKMMVDEFEAVAIELSAGIK